MSFRLVHVKLLEWLSTHVMLRLASLIGRMQRTAIDYQSYTAFLGGCDIDSWRSLRPPTFTQVND